MPDRSGSRLTGVGTAVSMYTDFPAKPSGRNKLPKAARLLRPTEFARVFKHGTRQQNRFFSFIYNKNSSVGQPPRLGIAVSKKNVRLAVARNRVKRVIREWFRVTDLSACGDVVVMARPGSGLASPRQLRQSLDSIKLPQTAAHPGGHGS